MEETQGASRNLVLAKSRGRKYAEAEDIADQSAPSGSEDTAGKSKSLGLKLNYSYSKLQRFASQLGAHARDGMHSSVRNLHSELTGEETLTQVGITIEWSRVSIEADARVGSSALPSIPAAARATVETIMPFLVPGEKKVKKMILDDVSGQLKPGRSTLLLGGPGSGKSALLSLLAGQIKSRKGLKVTGDISYSGRTANEFVPSRVIALVPQDDVHLATLSVEQTIQFAYECQGGAAAGRSKGAIKTLQEKFSAISNSAASKMEQGEAGAAEAGNGDQGVSIKQLWETQNKGMLMQRVFGLEGSLQTQVGSQFQRGISGGEKKRLSVAEMLVGPRPVLLLDQPSKGLDSSMTFTTIDFIATATRILNLTTVVALQQPSPEVMSLFDDIMLMSDGKVLYMGPLEECFPYLSTTFGLHRPQRKDPATFLLEVTTMPEAQQQYFSDNVDAYSSQIDNNTLTETEDEGSGGVSVRIKTQEVWVKGKGLAVKSFHISNYDSSSSDDDNDNEEDSITNLPTNPPTTTTTSNSITTTPRNPPNAPAQDSVSSFNQGRPPRFPGQPNPNFPNTPSTGFPPVTPQPLPMPTKPTTTTASNTTSVPTTATMERTKSKGSVSGGGGGGSKSNSSRNSFKFERQKSIASSSVPFALEKAFSSDSLNGLTPLSYIRALNSNNRNKLHKGTSSGTAGGGVVDGDDDDGSDDGSGWISTPSDMAEVWRHSKWYKFQQWQMTVPHTDEELAETEPLLVKESYGIGWFHALRLTTSRHLTVALRNKHMILTRSLQTLFMGIFIGGLFYQTPADSVPNSRLMLASGVMAMFFLSYINTAQMPVTYAQKTVLYKQMASNFFPPSVLPVALSLAHLPFLAVEVLLCTLPMYFMVGFTYTIQNFILFYLILYTTALCFTSFVRAVAVMVTSPVIAQSLWPVYDILTTIGSGFLIAYAYAPACFIWVFWISPFAYSTRAIANLEFSSSRWNVPAGEPYPADMDLGTAALQASGIQEGTWWIGVCFIFNLGCTILLTITASLAIAFIKPPSPTPIVHLDAPPTTETTSALTNGELPIGVDIGTTQEGATTSKQAAAPKPISSKWKKSVKVTKTLYRQVTQWMGSSAPTASPGLRTLQDTKEVKPAMGPLLRPSIDVEKGVGGGFSDKPSIPVSIVLKDVSYYVGAPTTWTKGVKQWIKTRNDNTDLEVPQKQLLRGITMDILPGNLHCLMGGSGAGKSTLLDVIACRKTMGTLTGQLLVNGAPPNPITWSGLVGYAEQEDVHSPRATVREALQFSARLRLPPQCSSAEVSTAVDEALRVMELESVANALVGAGGGEGLSGEQRKRLTIAVELVANPSVLFLDEPTTGLDGRAASVVVSCLRNISRSGRTVLASIHSPSLEIFEAFDVLALLQKGGKLVYFGPIGQSSTMLIDFLSSAEGVVPPQQGQNPATWALDVVSTRPTTAVLPGDVIPDFQLHYRSSELYHQTGTRVDETVYASLAARDRQAARATTASGGGIVDGDIEDGELSTVPQDGGNTAAAAALKTALKRGKSDKAGVVSILTSALSVGGSGGNKTAVVTQPKGLGFVAQVVALISKYSWVYWRTPEYTFVRLILNIVCALCYGLAYFGTGNSIRGVESVKAIEINSVLSALWMVSIYQGVFNMYAVFEMVARERAVLYRERAANYYHSMAWSLAVAIVELPYLVLQSLLFVPIVYYMAGLEPGLAHFAFYLLVFFLNITVYTFFGFLVLFLTPDTVMAQIVSAGVNYLFFGINGYLIPWSVLKNNGFFVFLNRIAPTTWSIYAIMADQLGRSTVVVEGTGGLTISEFLSDVYGYSYDDRWMAVGILAAFVGVFSVGAALTLRYVSYYKR